MAFGVKEDREGWGIMEFARKKGGIRVSLKKVCGSELQTRNMIYHGNEKHNNSISNCYVIIFLQYSMKVESLNRIHIKLQQLLYFNNYNINNIDKTFNTFNKYYLPPTHNLNNFYWSENYIKICLN